MKHVFFLLLAIPLLFSCNVIPAPEKGAEDQPLTLTSDCSAKDPVKELKWMQDLINVDSSCPVHTISSGIYEGETVFMPDVLSAFCCGCGGYAAYNCKGELLFSCDMEKSEKVTNVKVIWKR